MSEPIFSLVRSTVLSSSEATNYASGAAAVSDHDEVLLLDAHGGPGFVPTEQDHVSLDQEHRYSDGSIGVTPVLQQHRIAGFCDLMDSDLRRKLERWMRDRAEVYFTPGFGRRTEFSWRPLAAAASFLDLTGKYTLAIGADATRDNTWDAETGLRVMRDNFTGHQRILKTPAGAGQIFEGATENLYVIDDPQSGSPGWTAGGAGAASIAITHVANGFGHADCPHSCRIVGTATTDARSIASAVFSSAVAGLGTLNHGFFIKGRLPTGAVLGCYAASGNLALNGEYGDWTWVPYQWLDTFVSGEPYIYIALTTASTAETFDFQIAARTAVFTAAAGGAADGQYSMPCPQWQTSGAARTADTLTTTANVDWPQNGSAAVSFYVPADYDDAWTSQFIGLFGAPSGYAPEIYFVAYATSPRLRIAFYFSETGPKSLATYADGGLLLPGKVNSVVVTWSGPTIVIYLNGVVIASSSTASNAARNFVASTLRIGRRASGPFQMCAVRLEREPWTADRVAMEHRAMTDPGALELTVAARGRRYRINRIPSNPLPTAGKVYWSGTIELEQVGYSAAQADVTSMEPA